jgi:hypothetical protein
VRAPLIDAGVRPPNKCALGAIFEVVKIGLERVRLQHVVAVEEDDEPASKLRYVCAWTLEMASAMKRL